MADSVVPAVRAIKAMELTADGEFLLIHGEHATVALHRSTFNELLVALPNAIECSARISSSNGGARFALHSVGWEIGRIEESQNLVIRFYVLGGVGIGFSVPGEQVPLILEALCAAAGMSPVMAPTPGLTLQ
ncbi:hypothetical protein ACV229_26865 [Burkholderia sp. MR1-5-21]